MFRNIRFTGIGIPGTCAKFNYLFIGILYYVYIVNSFFIILLKVPKPLYIYIFQ